MGSLEMYDRNMYTSIVNNTCIKKCTRIVIPLPLIVELY